MFASHSATNGTTRFGVFEFDPRTGELRKRGIHIKLQEQPLQVLQILLERPGQIVTREELQRRLWPSDTFVEFNKGIYNAINRLRDTLSDTAETPRYIETLPRRGYRFVGLVNGSNGHVLPALGKTEFIHRRRWLRIGAVVGVLLLASAFVLIRWRIAGKVGSSAPGLKLVKLTDSSPENSAKYASISADGRLIAYTDALGIHVKDVETDEVKSIPVPMDRQASPGVSDARLPISWFPDGTRLLVSTMPGPSMWSVSLLTNKAQKLGQGGLASSVSPDGSLIAFVRNESEIWVMGPHGELPRAVAVAADSRTNFGRVLWTPDSRRIAYMKILRRPEALECAIETRHLDGGAPEQIISNAQLCQEQPFAFWSPDDRLVFSLRDTVGEGSNLWSVRVNRQTGNPDGQPVRITNWPQSFVTGISGSADGKRLALRRTVFRNLTYLMEIGAAGPTGSYPMRLLLRESVGAWPTAWTSDSRAVAFYRMNGGNTDTFLQNIDKDSPEPLAKGPSEQLTPRLSPDGSSFIYMEVSSFKRFGYRTPVRLMKISTSGGPSELILVSEGYIGHRCPRLPAQFCVLGETSPDQRHLTFYAFDPLRVLSSNDAQENKRQLLSIDIEPGGEPDWDVSPDGSLLAIAALDEHEIPIRFVSLNSRQDSQVTVKGWGNRHSLFWSADGKGVFISSRSFSEETLLQVDLQGRARPLYKQKGAYGIWGVPSPDGRYLAVFTVSKDSDVWMAENF